MDLKEQIGKKVKWLIDNENKYFFWVPLTAFVVGGAIAYFSWLGKFTSRRKMVDESCLVCYHGLRQVVLMPCNHLILCKQCSKVVENCPICRHHIEKVVPLGEYLSTQGV